MSFLTKLKLLFKTAGPAAQFLNQVKGAKFKYKTLPFWISLFGSAMTLVGSLQGAIPATTAVIIMSLLGAGYNLLRGVDKIDMDGTKPVLRTTEFYVGALAIVSNCLLEIKGAGVSNGVLVIMQTVVSAAMAASQNLAAHDPLSIPQNPIK